jgi:hypothetical protein
MSTTRAVWLFIIALTAIRLSMLTTSDLEFDEAHYWMWSERLAPAYFSKGPGVAFVMRASTAIFGANEFGVRFFSPVLAAGTSLLLFYFARRLFSANAGLWAVLAVNTTPIFNIGAFLMTIDPLSIFFWLASMFTFWLALEQSPRFSWHWLITGLLIGLGFLCKYTNALELISVVLVLALAPRLREQFARPGLYLLLGVFALCTVPPIVWNAQHAWITLTHLRSRGSLEQGFGLHPVELLAFLGEHFLSYSPLLFLGLAWGVIGSWRRINQQFKVLFLMWFGLPVFIFYLLLSINKAAAPNWDALSLLGFGLLALYFWRERIEASTWLRGSAAVAVALGLFMSVIALDTDVLQSAGLHLWRSDPSDRMRAGDRRPRRWKNCVAIWKGNLAINCSSSLMHAIVRRRFHFICAINAGKGRGIRQSTLSNRRTCSISSPFGRATMNLSKRSPVSRGRRARFTARRMASIHSSDAARSLSRTEKNSACLTTSGPPFNRANRLGRLKCGATASWCARGRFFSVGAIARCRYDGDDKLTTGLGGSAALQRRSEHADLAIGAACSAG